MCCCISNFELFPMFKSCLKQILTWLLFGFSPCKLLGFLWDTVLCPPPTNKKEHSLSLLEMTHPVEKGLNTYKLDSHYMRCHDRPWKIVHSCISHCSPLSRENIYISYLKRICKMVSHWRGTVSLHSQNTCCRDSAVHIHQPHEPEALQHVFMEQ